MHEYSETHYLELRLCRNQAVMTKENDSDGKAKEKKCLKVRNVNICPLSLSPFFPETAKQLKCP